MATLEISESTTARQSCKSCQFYSPLPLKNGKMSDYAGRCGWTPVEVSDPYLYSFPITFVRAKEGTTCATYQQTESDGGRGLMEKSNPCPDCAADPSGMCDDCAFANDIIGIGSGIASSSSGVTDDSICSEFAHIGTGEEEE